MFRDVIALLHFFIRVTFAYLKAFYRLFVSPSKVSVRGRVIVITGSGSGLGRELALRLAAEGARLALWDISDSGMSPFCLFFILLVCIVLLSMKKFEM